MSVASDGPTFTFSSKLTTVDINRNTHDVDIGSQCLADSEYTINTDCHQTEMTDSHGVAACTCRLSTCTAGCPSQIPDTDPGVGSTSETKPILRPPKKRRINLTLDESSAHSAEACHTSELSKVSPPVSWVDLTEWTGQRVLARHPTDSVYWPALIKSISTSHDAIVVQFEGSSEAIQTSSDDVISDCAPPSSGVFVGMRVCARIGTDRLEYRLGVVRERVVQPPVTKFLVDFDASDVTRDDVTSSVWVSRASLRLLQVLLHSQHWLLFYMLHKEFNL